MALQRVTIGIAHGTKQDCIGAFRQIQRGLRERMAACLIGGAANWRFFEYDAG